jgi:hypothetical protein
VSFELLLIAQLSQTSIAMMEELQRELRSPKKQSSFF